MIKKKQIGIDGCSESSNCKIHGGRWFSSQSAKSCAITLAENLVFLSCNDLSNKTRCSTFANFALRNSIFLSNPLSESILLKLGKTVSTFAGISGKLAGVNHKVSV